MIGAADPPNLLAKRMGQKENNRNHMYKDKQ